jgi:protein SCO1
MEKFITWDLKIVFMLNKIKPGTALLLLVALAGATVTACSTKTEGKEELAAQTLPYYQSPDFNPYWVQSKQDRETTVRHRLRPFSFHNQNGDTVTERTVLGRIHVADFFFTRCPSICPRMSNQFEVLQKEFMNDNDVILLSYTVDPENDSLPALKAYAELHGVKAEKWHLLRGDKRSVYSLGRTFYFAEKEEGYSKNPDQFLHTENFVLVDRGGYIRGIYNGTMPEETDRLIRDIATLKKE